MSPRRLSIAASIGEGSKTGTGAGAGAGSGVTTGAGSGATTGSGVGAGAGVTVTGPTVTGTVGGNGETGRDGASVDGAGDGGREGMKMAGPPGTENTGSPDGPDGIETMGAAGGPMKSGGGSGGVPPGSVTNAWVPTVPGAVSDCLAVGTFGVSSGRAIGQPLQVGIQVPAGACRGECVTVTQNRDIVTPHHHQGM